MLGILTAHIGFDCGPRSCPEAGQIAGNLNRPVRRRQKIERQRKPPAGNRGVLLQAEQLLHADMQGRSARAFIVERVPIARWRLEMRGSFGIKPLAR